MEVKPEHCFAITRAKIVAIFQVSLPVERQEAGDQLSNSDNKHSTFQRSRGLFIRGHCK